MDSIGFYGSDFNLIFSQISETFKKLAAVIYFQACHYQSISDSVMKGRFMDVLQELDYRIRGHTCKEKLVECMVVFSSFKPVISSGILLLVETKKAHVVEGDGMEDKVENVDCFIMPE